MLGIFKRCAFTIEGISCRTRGFTYPKRIAAVSQEYQTLFSFFLNQKIEGYLRDTYRAVSGQYPSIGAVSGWIRALSEVSALRSWRVLVVFRVVLSGDNPLPLVDICIHVHAAVLIKLHFSEASEITAYLVVHGVVDILILQTPTTQVTPSASLSQPRSPLECPRC